MRSAIPTSELLIVATLFLGGIAFEGGLAIVGGHCFAELEWDAALRVAIDDHRPQRLPIPEVDWIPPRRSAGRQSHGIADAAGSQSFPPPWCPLLEPFTDGPPGPQGPQDVGHRRHLFEERCRRSEVCPRYSDVSRD